MEGRQVHARLRHQSGQAQHKRLEPVYSVNSEGFWLIGDNAQVIPAGSPTQLLEWRQLSLALASDAAVIRSML